MKRSLSSEETLALRLRAQRLDPAGAVSGSPAEVLEAVCGVQAQEMPAAALALRPRSSGLLESDVERARLQERSVIRTWCQRGTLHLLSAKDYGWMLPLLGPLFASGSRSRELELGWDEETFEKGIGLLERVLADRGPMTRKEIAGRLNEHGLPAEGQAPIHLIARTALLGVLVQGPDLDGEPAFVRVEDWLGKGAAPGGRLRGEPDREQAAATARLARRYLQAYGPARPQDLAAWSGISMGAARAAWDRIAGDLAPVEIPGGQAWMLKESLAWLDELQISRELPSVRLLPRFDTYLLGYSSRELAVKPEHAKHIQPGGGILHAALLVDGQALGRWSLKRRRDHLEVKVEPFEDLPQGVEPGLEAEAEDLGRFLNIKSSLTYTY